MKKTLIKEFLKIIIVAAMIILVFRYLPFIILQGLTWYADVTHHISPQNRSAAVLNVKDNMGCIGNGEQPEILCENEDAVYLVSDGHLIYRYHEDSLELIKDTDERKIHSIVSTEKYLIYYAETDESNGVYRLEPETGTEKTLLQDVSVYGMLANNEDVFIKDDDGRTYIFEGDSVEKTELTALLNPLETEQDYTNLYGEYGAYEIYGCKKDASETGEVQVIRKKDGSWQGSIDEAASYVTESGALTFSGDTDGTFTFQDKKYSLKNYVTDKTKRENDTKIFSAFSTWYADTFYSLNQYCKMVYYPREYKINAASHLRVYDEIIAVSPISEEQESLYKTDNSLVRIVGFDAENRWVYLYDMESRNILKYNLLSGEEIQIGDTLPPFGDVWFGWADGRLFVFFGEETGMKFYETVN